MGKGKGCTEMRVGGRGRRMMVSLKVLLVRGRGKRRGREGDLPRK